MNFKTAMAGALSAVVLIAPSFAFAQTSTSSIQTTLDSISSLQKQILDLQSKQNQLMVDLNAQLMAGSSGDQVKILQTLLASDANLYPEGMVTGYYGPATMRAIKRFQKEHGLPQVGNVGPKTLALLRALLIQNQIAFNWNGATTTPTGGKGDDDNRGKKDKRYCLMMPPGHMIAPGWLRKHDKDGDDDDKRFRMTYSKSTWCFPAPGTGTTTPPTPPPTTDTTAPTLSGVSVQPSLTSATVTWNTNEFANGKVLFGTTTAYGTMLAQSALSTGHSFTLSSLTPSTLYHFLVVSADNNGNTATSSDSTFTTLTPDTVSPIISSPTVSGIGSTTATVSWNTNESATSKAYFGTANPLDLGVAAAVTVAGMSTAHTVSLSGLTASTTYQVVLESKDAANNTATSSPLTFTTSN